MWLNTCPSARIFMLGMANAMAHVYYELLILDGHQDAFAGVWNFIDIGMWASFSLIHEKS